MGPLRVMLVIGVAFLVVAGSGLAEDPPSDSPSPPVVSAPETKPPSYQPPRTGRPERRGMPPPQTDVSDPDESRRMPPSQTRVPDPDEIDTIEP